MDTFSATFYIASASNWLRLKYTKYERSQGNADTVHCDHILIHAVKYSTVNIQATIPIVTPPAAIDTASV